MTSKLVQKFNALPRKRKAPSGMVANDWHFDIRYIHLEPPSHILTLIQPQSRFIHTERLPVGLPRSESGIAFFPESAKEAAPEVAKALLHAFADNLGLNKMMGSNAPPAFGPWKLTTEDKDLADAVGAELKRLGVRPDELCRIGVSSNSVNKIMQDTFHDLFNGLKKNIGFEGSISSVISTPSSIALHNLHVRPPPESRVKEQNELAPLMKYIESLEQSRPPQTDIADSHARSARIKEEEQLVRRLIADKPANVIKEDADAGDPHAALDYGLRLLVGLECRYDRTLARAYLIKALSSPRASDGLKCTAHGLLIRWYLESTSGGAIRGRYIFAACYHANIAAYLCRRVSPPGTHASPAVLTFMIHVLEPQSRKVPELSLFFSDAWKALEDRKLQMATGREKMEEKRLKNPNRYRCAAVGCTIEADVGNMLSKCAGKCDPDKKPSYCSKECQRADWKNHKPFCTPGAPCSVIDPGPFRPMEAGPSSRQGAIQIPVARPDGSTMLVSSSTFDPKFMKDFGDHLEVLMSADSSSTHENGTRERRLK
ncbi:hypothetical protein BDZ97DRAFT_114645 [Flammula alnicola]|nr:hypothetical protein BDZ97DRAFT_114645 [Flammula alnicola]